MESRVEQASIRSRPRKIGLQSVTVSGVMVLGGATMWAGVGV